MKHPRRTWVVITTLAAVFLLLPEVRAPRAESGQEHPEWTLFYAANRERAARNLGPLQWDRSLAEAARRHALLMESQGALSHQFAGEMTLIARLRLAGARFVAAAENVAEGPSAEIVHTEWMKSAPHRENLLDPELNSMGAAVAERNGELFAVEDFTRTIANVSFEEQGKQVGALFEVRGLRVVSDDSEARKICEGGQALRLAAATRIFSVRYTTADLNALPSALLRELENGHYRAAAIAACQSDGEGSEGGFTEYHLGVLLYE